MPGLVRKLGKSYIRSPRALIFSHNSKSKIREKLESTNELVKREVREEGFRKEELRSSSLENAR